MIEPDATATREDLEAAVLAMTRQVSWEDQKVQLAEYFSKISGQMGRWAELPDAQASIEQAAAVVALASMGTAELLAQAAADVDELGSRTPTESAESAALWAAARALHDSMGQMSAIIDQPGITHELAAASAVFVMMMGRAGHGLVIQAQAASAAVVEAND